MEMNCDLKFDDMLDIIGAGWSVEEYEELLTFSDMRNVAFHCGLKKLTKQKKIELIERLLRQVYSGNVPEKFKGIDVLKKGGRKGEGMSEQYVTATLPMLFLLRAYELSPNI